MQKPEVDNNHWPLTARRHSSFELDSDFWFRHSGLPEGWFARIEVIGCGGGALRRRHRDALRRGVAALSGPQPVELNFWNGYTGPDGRVMLQMVRQFNAANPDVRVTMQRMAWATFYNKLMVAAAAGRGPEVYCVHASTLTRMSGAGILSPVDELYGPGGIDRMDVDDIVMKQVVMKGHVVGMPLDIHPQGMYCNADLLKAGGCVDEQGNARPPRDRAEFVGLLRRSKKDLDGDGRADQWGFAFTNWAVNAQSLLMQFGGGYFDKEGHPKLDLPENIEALTFLKSLIDDGLVPPLESQASAWIGFRQGKVACVFEGPWMIGDLMRVKSFNYLGAPIPTLGSKRATHADSHVICVKPGLDARQREAAVRFLKFLSDHSLEWAAAGQVPARKSLRATSTFDAMQVQHAFGTQVPELLYPPPTRQVFEFSEKLGLAVEKVLRGRQTPEEALRQADAEFRRFSTADGPQEAVGR